MLNVSYKNRMGHFTLTQGESKYQIWFCHANALCAMMYFYDETDKDGNKTPMVQVYAFFNDMAHAKRCVKDGFFEGCSDFHFVAKELDSQMWRLVKLLADNGIKVTIE